MDQTGTSSPFLLLPDGMSIASTHTEKNCLVVDVACCLQQACCPLCQQPSERIHGGYVRTVADLPCGGQRILLKLSVRKFVCGFSGCPRKIFTERLDCLVQSYARMTNRLSEALQSIGFATCGELGERLAPKLGMQVSGPTLLRRMRARIYTPPEQVSIVGIDDWAWRKGVTYGTLVVDLQRRRPIELLPDRSAETAEAWLRTHPEITLVSRDRGGDYAAAARRGAPQAIQVADKFHLLKNLRERLKDLMERRHSCLPEVETIRADVKADAIPAKAQGLKREERQKIEEVTPTPAETKRYRTIPPTPYVRSGTMEYAALQKSARRDKRIARYEAVRALWAEGVGIREIARRLKMCRQVVRQFITAQDYPERTPSRPRPQRSQLDPYKPYLLERWQQECRNSVQLYDEIKSRGYPGSARTLRVFLADLRKQHREVQVAEKVASDGSQQASRQSPVRRRLSSAQASWLFVKRADKLDEKQRKSVGAIQAGHPDLETAYPLAQSFVMMLAERRAADLDTWLTQAEQSGLPEFKKMAKGILLDYAAVKAALTSEWSNGLVA